ncbi:uncharacterized protein LOC131022750 [Salvia miltiorrhiza]|uniref:uncharacterized protein LOC131022750 n=1 Tax=Salvia miltiorrhiza TaxID=226208 RepID=UPI0025AD1A8D|nr:uncharacterized protein LOC131022750 [Salvia miltiorrhiza]
MQLFLSLKGQIKCLQDLVDTKFKMIEAYVEKYTSGASCSCGSKLDCLDKGQKGKYLGNEYGVADRLSNHESPVNFSHVDTGVQFGGDKNLYEIIEDEDYVGTDIVSRKTEAMTLDRSNVSEAVTGDNNGDCTAGQFVYDPNEFNTEFSQLKPYLDWTCSPDNIRSQNQVILPTDIQRYADLSWFNILWRPNGWLDNSHIDALINLLIIRYDKEVKSHKPRTWACLEICCWQALTKTNMDDIIPVVMPYVCGVRPVSGGLNWLNATHVFGVGNINNCHWVFFDISLADHVITVYNSVQQSWECVYAHFQNVRKNLAILCRLGGLCSRNHAGESWYVVEYPRPPRQLNQSDCGIMAMKYMECRAFDVPVSKIIPHRCAKFRRRYCAKLFEHSEELKRTLKT